MRPNALDFVILSRARRARVEGRVPHQIGKPDPRTRDAVDVRRANPASRRADGLRARRFSGFIALDVMRKDDVRAIGDLNARRIDADLRECIELADERLEIDDRSSADEELDAGMHDARGNDPQRELTIAHNDRMPRVVAARKARYDVVIRGIEIDDPALALVAPLQPDDNVSFRWHGRTLLASSPVNLWT